MDWFNQIGNMLRFFPDTPALAWDMALNGANPDLAGYGLAYGMQSSATVLDPYPTEAAAPDLGA
ncbi:hypothetical protein [Streptomyces tsukubensis]|uniref:hypothetical protein n=1 Tax=Streptomyces tsukubensis TaxID=83656 RepID=UPI00344D9F2B